VGSRSLILCLVRPTRARWFLPFAVATVVAACRTYDGVPVRGAFAGVSPADLRAATVAVQPFLHGRPGAYEIVSESEIRVLYTADPNSSYRIARKSDGKWHEDGGAVVLVHPVRQ
jgi:hypothetical protein